MQEQRQQEKAWKVILAIPPILIIIFLIFGGIKTYINNDMKSRAEMNYKVKDFSVSELYSSKDVKEFYQRGYKISGVKYDKTLILYSDRGKQPYRSTKYEKVSFSMDLDYQNLLIYEGAIQNPNLLSTLDIKNNKVNYKDLNLDELGEDTKFLIFENKSGYLMSIVPTKSEITKKDLKKETYVKHFKAIGVDNKALKIAFTPKVKVKEIQNKATLQKYLKTAEYAIIPVTTDTTKGKYKRSEYSEQRKGSRLFYHADNTLAQSNSLDADFSNYLANNRYTLTLRDIVGDYEGHAILKDAGITSNYTVSSGRTSSHYSFSIYGERNVINSTALVNFTFSPNSGSEPFDFKQDEGVYQNLLDKYLYKEDGTIRPSLESYDLWEKNDMKRNHKYLVTKNINDFAYGVYDITNLESTIYLVDDNTSDVRSTFLLPPTGMYYPSYLLRDTYTEKEKETFGGSHVIAAQKGKGRIGVYFVGQLSSDAKHLVDGGLVFSGKYQVINTFEK